MSKVNQTHFYRDEITYSAMKSVQTEETLIVSENGSEYTITFINFCDWDYNGGFRRNGLIIRNIKVKTEKREFVYQYISEPTDRHKNNREKKVHRKAVNFAFELFELSRF